MDLDLNGPEWNWYIYIINADMCIYMSCAHKMRQAKVSQISAGTYSYTLSCALDWLL